MFTYRFMQISQFSGIFTKRWHYVKVLICDSILCVCYVANVLLIFLCLPLGESLPPANQALPLSRSPDKSLAIQYA